MAIRRQRTRNSTATINVQVALSRALLKRVARVGHLRYGSDVSSIECLRRFAEERVMQLERTRGLVKTVARQARDETQLLKGIVQLLQQLVDLQRGATDDTSPRLRQRVQ
jgi:hypothetical protein